MLEQAAFTIQGHNPDVLTCIANLSNDEVFTPPEFANQMLDTLEQSWADANDGANIWADKSVTFLDPFTKSGVFLREIARRLTEGLVEEIPDLGDRVDHILTKQVYGIGITELTSLLARRSLYCSKYANGPHSIAASFDTEAGNIWFERTEHAWAGGKKEFIVDPTTGREVEVMVNRKCQYCGARETEYGRGEDLETHAYGFIHTDDVDTWLARLFGEKMQFDVVIGNPPYQLNDGGGKGSSASPIYQKFVYQAQRLEPKFVSLVIPARWYSGGKGLDDFRSAMLGDRRIRYLADFPDSRDAFTGVDVAGGVCYFLWGRDSAEDCLVETFSGGKTFAAKRVLDEFEIFIRDNREIGIVRKILSAAEVSFSQVVSSRKPFGLEAAQKSSPEGTLYLFASGADGKIHRENVPKGDELIDRWKVLLSKTSSEHAGQTDNSGKKRVLSRIDVMPPKSVCTESYLVIGPFESKKQSMNVVSYLKTKFFRFLVSTTLLTQNITKGKFVFVPIQDFSKPWTDEELYAKYSITDEEIAFIESRIRPMDLNDE
jgi:hypothetical protein